MNKIVISVVTIVYNDCSHIERTIQSVLNQDYPEVDYIVVDGLSTDGTSDIISNYASQINTFVSEKDKGIYDAMNKGLRLAVGDYIIFMNSGDCFSDNSVLSQIVQCIKSFEVRPVMVYGDYRQSYEFGFSPVIPSRSYKKAWYGAFASHQSTLYNLHFLRDYNICYDLSYKIAADYKLNLEVVKNANDAIEKINLCISDFDMTGVSQTNQSKGLQEADRARKEALEMSYLCRKAIILLTLSAHALKKYFNPLYTKLRMK